MDFMPTGRFGFNRVSSLDEPGLRFLFKSYYYKKYADL